MFQASRLSLLDLGVILAYFAGLAIAGWLDKRRVLKARDHFLGGNSASWPRVGLSLYATTISAITLVGVTGSAYAHGISVFNYEWPAAILLIVFCACVLPTYIRSQVYTVPEFLELRYGRFVRTYVSGLSIVLGVMLDASGALFAGGVLFQILFPAWPLWQVCVLLALLAGAFLILGGLRAILTIEGIQGVIMVTACACLAWFTYHAAGGWQHALAQVPPSHLKLVLPASDPIMPWTGLITGVPLIGFYFWCTNQTMVQRVLAARSLDEGRLGSLLGGALKLTSLFLVILPGAAAITLFPHLDQPDEVFSHIVFDILPHGLIGLIIAACLVSLLAGLAGIYNATSTLLTMDFIRRLWPNLDDMQLVHVGKWMAALLMAVSVMWAPQIVHFPGLWQYLQALLCYFVPPIAAVFLGGLFVRRVNARGAAWALCAGTTASIVLFVGIAALHAIPLHFLVAAIVIFAVSLTALVAGSLTTAAPDPGKIAPLMFSRAVWDAETEHLKTVPWYRNYRYLSVGLFAVTVAIVIRFA
ncbi:sodium:solute symporter family transporter [Asticcacaulis solisilvae]|uniref:sodium:solute symporter family transporter n=1 Tax=Asticcacaulis solisilvae TaxID=1217274 RepID=UPI003FD8DAED